MNPGKAPWRLERCARGHASSYEIRKGGQISPIIGDVSRAF
jgi:hypothetical protein